VLARLLGGGTDFDYGQKINEYFWSLMSFILKVVALFLERSILHNLILRRAGLWPV
jgi:hypothetical protein